ncbi:unnamed protein product [Rotaria sordida]|uniref:Plastocyanin-like domain-containing protein n=1 Tax=Rotaria sordida TaxID=392033 RepID=A0A816CUN6_9BILA|nr:unnamed protein product [Rotaria sordida]CAF1453357.1 unnamed protein product [Rotaria sordida]CAF1626466.1 unnamed protein product [Rotaria sordida]CAF4057342.1 unnamed protein product [Rotaria sordida]
MCWLISLIFLVSLYVCNSQVPPSPFGNPSDICPQANNYTYEVDGFVGTPYILKPFQNNFVNPPIISPSSKVCRTDGHCMFSYTVDVIDTTARPFDQSVPACVNKPATKFLSYNNKIPGPTFIVPSGHESIVRFNNKIGNLFPECFSPCIGNRTGRPFSVHHHGSASIPPYDGWAEDETCYGETKEYVYPNNRPAINWYHDHALHITAKNAYLGLAGLHLVSSKVKNGGCGEPWNLEDIEEKHIILQDKVLDSNCQLFIDTLDIHEKSLYGDINMMSGIPFPLMCLEPKWYRFRILNGAVSRPFLLKIKNNALQDVSQQICKIFGTDGGFRDTPVTFPTTGLLIGIAERYDVVCDFRALKNQILYMWNHKDDTFMKDVPYFCYSHLLAKLQISATTSGSSPEFQENMPNPVPEKPIKRVLNNSDINIAINMANQGQFHRRMVFGRSNGHWVINGETWDTFKIAAENIGQNTWELWLYETGGGWFHPVHMHLVDFYIIKRDGDNGLRSYEVLSPKDVLYLGAGNKLWVIARFGAHKGDYMFHCHNLIHEDDDMMRAMRIIDSQNGLTASTAQPFILNGFANIVYSNWKYNNPMLTETSAKPTNQMPTFNTVYIQDMLCKNIYRIFYPNSTDEALNGFPNPWRSTWCPT